MVMKTKPAMGLETQPQMDEWRKVDPERVTTHHDGRDARISKTVRMRLRFSEMLRDEAFRRSRETGNKVSEADLIDEAMQEWRMKHDIPAE